MGFPASTSWLTTNSAVQEFGQIALYMVNPSQCGQLGFVTSYWLEFRQTIPGKWSIPKTMRADLCLISSLVGVAKLTVSTEVAKYLININC